MYLIFLFFQKIVSDYSNNINIHIVQRFIHFVKILINGSHGQYFDIMLSHNALLFIDEIVLDYVAIVIEQKCDIVKQSI